MNVNKYIVVAKNTWAEMLTYRLNFVMWRVRGIVFLLSLYFLWLAVIPEKGLLFGYTRSLMLTYVLGSLIVNSIVVSSRSYVIGDEINQGNLSSYLIRPVNYFFYWFAKDLGDKVMNLTFALVELTILFFILRPPVVLQTNPIYIIPFLLALAIGIVLYFFSNLLLGFIGFWSPEVWAPRFIFFMISSFFTGVYFPLDILPKTVFAIFQFLPFPYIVYFPLKIYLGQLSSKEILIGIVVSLAWVGVFYGVSRRIWQKGLKVYTAYGN